MSTPSKIEKKLKCMKYLFFINSSFHKYCLILFASPWINPRKCFFVFCLSKFSYLLLCVYYDHEDRSLGNVLTLIYSYLTLTGRPVSLQCLPVLLWQEDQSLSNAYGYYLHRKTGLSAMFTSTTLAGRQVSQQCLPVHFFLYYLHRKTGLSAMFMGTTCTFTGRQVSQQCLWVLPSLDGRSLCNIYRYCLARKTGLSAMLMSTTFTGRQVSQQCLPILPWQEDLFLCNVYQYYLGRKTSLSAMFMGTTLAGRHYTRLTAMQTSVFSCCCHFWFFKLCLLAVAMCCLLCTYLCLFTVFQLHQVSFNCIL